MSGRDILRRLRSWTCALSVAMSFFVAPGHAQIDPCGWPPGIAPVPTRAQPAGEQARPPERLDVWMDASLSMRGYVTRGNRPARDYPLAMLARQLPEVLSGHAVETVYNRFGTHRDHDIGRAAFQAAATRRFYEDYGINQESHPWEALQAALESDRTAIVLSDLFLDDGTIAGDTSAMTQPLGAMLRRGWTITVVGVLSRFSGTIYDLPNEPDLPLTDGWTPFYLLVMGPAEETAWLTHVLREEVLPLIATRPPGNLGLGRVEIARFGLRTTVRLTSTEAILRAGGAQLPPRRDGVMVAPRLAAWLQAPALRVRIDSRERWDADTTLHVQVPVAVQAPPGVTATVEPAQPRVQAWASPVDPHAMLCPPDPANAWRTLDGAPLVAGWRADGGTISVDLFPPRPPLELHVPRDQLVFARVTVPVASVTISATSADWMERWGFAGEAAAATRASAAASGVMPTLNLGDLGSSLERLDRLTASWRGADGLGTAAVIDVLFVVED